MDRFRSIYNEGFFLIKVIFFCFFCYENFKLGGFLVNIKRRFLL